MNYEKMWHKLKNSIGDEVNKYQDEKNIEEEWREAEACDILIKMLDLESSVEE